jgi:hypothetical protein
MPDAQNTSALDPNSSSIVLETAVPEQKHWGYFFTVDHPYPEDPSPPFNTTTHVRSSKQKRVVIRLDVLLPNYEWLREKTVNMSIRLSYVMPVRQGSYWPAVNQTDAEMQKHMFENIGHELSRDINLHFPSVQAEFTYRHKKMFQAFCVTISVICGVLLVVRRFLLGLRNNVASGEGIQCNA